jgi:hypothetical protein
MVVAVDMGGGQGADGREDFGGVEDEVGEGGHDGNVGRILVGGCVCDPGDLVETHMLSFMEFKNIRLMELLCDVERTCLKSIAHFSTWDSDFLLNLTFRIRIIE